MQRAPVPAQARPSEGSRNPGKAHENNFFAETEKMTVEQRLRSLDIELPHPSAAGANYVPFTTHGTLVYLTGQLCQWNGERRFIGKLGSEFDVDSGRRAARLRSW